MKRFLQHSLVVGVLLSALSLSAQAKPIINELNVTKQSGDTRQVSAKMMIDAPPSFVWQALTSYNDFSSFVPGYKRCSVMKKQGAKVLLDINMSIARFVPSFHYQVNVQENRRDLSVSMVRTSGDFKHLAGSYRLIPINQGKKTMMVYSVRLDPGINLPGTNHLIQSNTEKSLTAF
jgi:ribosome-associated toxin RatA of RatAB toxin-antitoxin module